MTEDLFDDLVLEDDADDAHFSPTIETDERVTLFVSWCSRGRATRRDPRRPGDAYPPGPTPPITTPPRVAHPPSEREAHVPRGDTPPADPLDFLARVIAHIPEPRSHLVRYVGHYSNVSRGCRKKQFERLTRLSEEANGSTNGSTLHNHTTLTWRFSARGGVPGHARAF